MRVLALETSSSTGSVAVVEHGGSSPFSAEIVASASARVSNAHGESLLPIVESVLRSARVELAQIDLLAVGIGPGSFTGTRIAVATAKGIALASQKPLRGVDAFAALAIDAGAEPGFEVVVAIDARKGEVYLSVVRVLETDVETLVPPVHVPPSDVHARVASFDRALVVGDAARSIPELAPRARRRVGVEVPRAAAVAALAASRHQRAPLDEADVLEPLYVRPPDVTIPTRAPGLPRGAGGRSTK